MVTIDRETVIIGAGIAGMACARQLHDRQRPFMLITETVGGRIRPSADGAVNLGAYYLREDYRHVRQFVDLGRSIKRLGVRRHDDQGSYGYWDRRFLLHLPEAFRFILLLTRFHNRYEAFKENSVLMSQAGALRADAWLWSLYHEPAGHFLKRNRIESIGRHYLAPTVRGTAFTSMDRLSAFALLLLALPAIMPIYEFRIRFDRLLRGFERSLLVDSATAITPLGLRYMIHTASAGIVVADNVVVAAPIDVAARLLDLGSVKGPITAHSFVVEGELRRRWADAAINLFGEDDPTLAIARQADGSTLLCSRSEQPEFARFFITWEVVEHHHWNPAFHLEGDVLLECEQAPNLYLIGDHNVCGLEDAFITGLHAATRILARRRAPAPQPTG